VKSLSFPTDVRDQDTLNAWLETLAVPQRNVTQEELAKGDLGFNAFGFGMAVTRKALMDNPKAKEEGLARTAGSLAFLLLGFFSYLSEGEGVVYRCRPELEERIDPITSNLLWVAYVRLGKETIAG
jgi:hypothetical protein